MRYDTSQFVTLSEAQELSANSGATGRNLRCGQNSRCRNLIFVSLIPALFLVAASDQAHANYRKLTKQGNEAFKKGDFEEALKKYKEADVEKPQQPVIEYNIGTALFNQSQYEDAVKRFSQALNTQDEAAQADAYYNLGNSFFRAERYPEAINAFKKTLELNPDDADAKYNLELARKRLKDQSQQKNQDQQQNQEQNQDQQDQQQQDQQQQQQQDQQQQQQDQPQQDQQQQQEQQGRQGQEQEQQQQQEQQGRQGDQQQQQDKGAGDDQKMSKEDAMRLLRAVGNDEKDLQKKMRRSKMTDVRYQGKDW